MLYLFRALRGKSFALLWSGQTVSVLGDNIFHIALAWWVLEKTGSAIAMGTVLLFSIVPMLVFLLVGGVVVDRFPRLRLMFLSDVSRALIIGALAALSYTGVLVLWHA